MGLTKRQEEMISQIIIEESKAAHQSQQERHRILNEIDEPTVVTEAPEELSRSIQYAVEDLIESFTRNNELYEGSLFDGGAARRQAARYLKRLIENDVKQVQQMLQEGDFEADLDDDR